MNKEKIKLRILNILTIVIFIYVVGTIFNACSSAISDSPKTNINSYSSQYHRDYTGYHGCRRGSSAEETELKANGYDVTEYRASHGYEGY